MNDDWQITKKGNLKLTKPVLIEGLPGLGNVGKIAADFIVEELKAQKFIDFFSYSLPNTVFVNEDDLVDLPKIEIYHKKIKEKDFLFLTGDVQPMDEHASYIFCEKVLDICEKHRCSEIVTLGGIGIDEEPEKPKVFCTGNNRKFVDTFKPFKANPKIYGRVGPVIGVSGLLLGLGDRRGIKAAAILAETFGHPMFVGVKGAKELLKVLNKRYDFGISLNRINKEIKRYSLDADSDKKHTAINQLKQYKEISYIG